MVKKALYNEKQKQIPEIIQFMVKLTEVVPKVSAAQAKAFYFGLFQPLFCPLFFDQTLNWAKRRKQHYQPKIKSPKTLMADFKQKIVQIMVIMAQFNEKSNQRYKIVQFMVKQTIIVDQTQHGASKCSLFRPYLALCFRPNVIFGLFTISQTVDQAFQTIGLFILPPIHIWSYLRFPIGQGMRFFRNFKAFFFQCLFDISLGFQVYLVSFCQGNQINF